ncbi:MAG: hypothetical protein AAF862_07925 [Pseudomonadota bacterium]
MHDVLTTWLEAVAEAKLTKSGEVIDFIRENQLWFSLSVAEAKALQTQDVDQFIHAAMKAYALKLSGASSKIYFYAWHDAMAGQLRTGAVPATRAEELPFGCRLLVVDNPTPVSVELLNSAYLDGIPWSELEDVSVASTADDEDETDFELTIFAQPIV